MLVYRNKPTLLLMVHQHGGDDVTCIRSIERFELYFNSEYTSGYNKFRMQREGEKGKEGGDYLDRFAVI